MKNIKWEVEKKVERGVRKEVEHEIGSEFNSEVYWTCRRQFRQQVDRVIWWKVYERVDSYICVMK